MKEPDRWGLPEDLDEFWKCAKCPHFKNWKTASTGLQKLCFSFEEVEETRGEIFLGGSTLKLKWILDLKL
jgi:hypothetical protein